MSNREQQQSRPRMWPPVAETESVSFGTWLRRQREIREVSLREIADVTKISIRYLEALEHDRFDVLPAPVFAKGFLREYARYVGLDPDEVVNSYLNAQEDLEPEEEEEPPRSRSGGGSGKLQKTSGLLLAAAIVVLLGIVGALAYYLERREAEAQPEPPPIAAPPVEIPVAAEPEPEPMRTAPLLVTIDFTGESWVEAVVDDTDRISELHVAGESLQIQGQQRIVLTLGDPEAAMVEVNGERFPVSAPAGTVARDIVIDLSAIDQEGVASPGPEDSESTGNASQDRSEPLDTQQSAIDPAGRQDP